MRSVVPRVLGKLEDAERSEVNPHFQSDYRIAWITVLRAARGESFPHVSATYAVLGLHPEKVWPAIVERRKALLGGHCEKFPGVSVPAKKPVQSESDPRWKNRAA